MLEHVIISDLGVSAAFNEIRSDPGVNWEEESGIDFDMSINDVDMPILQKRDEKEVSMLHELSGEEVTDVE